MKDERDVRAHRLPSPNKEAAAIVVALIVSLVWAATTIVCLIIREYTALVTIQPVMLLAVGFLIGFKRNGLNGRGL